MVFQKEDRQIFQYFAILKCHMFLISSGNTSSSEKSTKIIEFGWVFLIHSFMKHRPSNYRISACLGDFTLCGRPYIR